LRLKRNGKIYRAEVTDRTVFNCFIIGASGCGKTSLLESFLGRPFSNAHAPTIHENIAVNNVELAGGKQCYLIMEELGSLENAILDNRDKINSCDVLCFAYDSSDSDSFQHLIDIKNRYKYLDNIPSVFVALKADLDKQQQRSDFLPEPYAKSLNLESPLHISSNWIASMNELMNKLVHASMHPRIATPGLENESQKDNEPSLTPFTIGCGAIGFMTLATAIFMQGYFIGGKR